MVPAAGAAAATLSSEIARCSAIAAPDARLKCYDHAASGVQRAAAAPAGSLAGIGEPPPAQSEPMTVPMDATPQPSDGRAASTPVKERPTWFGVRPYRRNYALVASYNDDINRDFADEALDLPFVGDALDSVEVKFQLSFEVPVWRNLLRDDLDVYFAYTQLSFFQAYNQEYSAPFRETNYEPELGLHWHPRGELFGWRLESARIAMNHQSNGRSQPLSRSWNRLIGQAQVERGELSLGLRLWTLLGDRTPSDNPDIIDFYGNGELYAGYRLGRHNLAMMVRNLADHPAVQLDWTYPLSSTVRLYVQYFNGYGESLLDYDHSVNRIGIGFALNEWP